MVETASTVLTRHINGRKFSMIAIVSVDARHLTVKEARLAEIDKRLLELNRQSNEYNSIDGVVVGIQGALVNWPLRGRGFRVSINVTDANSGEGYLVQTTGED